MKTFKKFLAIFVAVSCCLAVLSVSAMAVEEGPADVVETEEASVYATNNVRFTGSTTQVTLTQNFTRIRYSSAAQWGSTTTRGFVTLRFTSGSTVRTYSFDVEMPRLDTGVEGLIKCNIPAGTYTITKVAGTAGLNAEVNMSFTNY